MTADEDMPSRDDLKSILQAVNIEYPELEYFPKQILDVVVRMWHSAKYHAVGRDKFVRDLTSPLGVIAVGYLTYAVLHNQPAG